MNDQYYFLSSALPELRLDLTPQLSSKEFIALAKDSLSNSDYRQIKTLLHYYDLKNLHAYLGGSPFICQGSMNQKELKESLRNGDGLAEYIHIFWDLMGDDQQRLASFSSLYVSFFQEELKKARGILRLYLELERSSRLVFAALRFKVLNRDIALELQYEDAQDPLVFQILSQKDALYYEPLEEFKVLKTIFEKNEDNPSNFHQDLLIYKFNYIEERLVSENFSMNKIIGYFIQLLLLEESLLCNRTKGESIVNTMLERKL